MRQAGVAPGRQAIRVGDEVYLWLLVAIEVVVLASLRGTFRRQHGG